MSFAPATRTRQDGSDRLGGFGRAEPVGGHVAGEDSETRKVYLTVPQLHARWPHASESTIRRWVDSGDLPGIQARGRYGRRKVEQADADAFEANGFKKVT